ncbi:MAG: hypothetical protein K6G37_03185 [Bacilli bacterium]|nr:hypothetical protein [Bacilli bacterium]
MEENKVAETKKIGSKKPLYIIITCLVLIIAGLLTYIFAFKDKDAKKDNSNAQTQKTPDTKPDTKPDAKPVEKENRNLTDNEIATLVSMIKEYHLYDLVDFNKKVTFSKTNITNNMMLAFAYYAGFGSSDNIAISTADKYFEKVYGFKNAEYKDILCLIDDEVFYKYDKESEYFKRSTEYEHGHGWPTIGFADYVVRDAKKEDSEYIISALFLSGGGESDYYVNDTKLETTLDTYENSQSEFIKEFRDNLSKYDNVKPVEFTFVKEDGNYHLKSIELKK